MSAAKHRPSRRILLVVLEGWGVRREIEGNVVAIAHKPNFDRLWTTGPRTTLSASSIDVGLPAGLKGSLEAGYLTLGAGRVVPSENVRLDTLIESGAFFEQPALQRALATVKKRRRRLHLLGLVSDGNVHSRDSHWLALLEAAQRCGVPSERVVVHAILDGRDTAPRAGLTHVARLMAELVALGAGTIGTVMGRAYAMDRDGQRERTEQAAQLLARNQGLLAPNPVDAVRKGYQRGETDETLSPTLILGEEGLPPAPIAEGDTLICFNLGRSRTAQLQARLTGADGNALIAADWHWLSAADSVGSVLFPVPAVSSGLCETLLEAGKRLAIASPESRDEQTRFWFTGCRERSEIRNGTPEEVDSLLRDSDFVLACLTDVEEAGHSGNMTAAVGAVERVDQRLGEWKQLAGAAEADLLITSTHGNAEQMINPDLGGPYPSHTTNPVPFIVSCRTGTARLRPDGTLADIAPTLLAMMGLPIPGAMEGIDLRVAATTRPRRLHPKHPHVHPEALAAIEAGLREEVDSARFYLLAAATTRDAASKELCLKLAHDEELHLAKLRTRYEELTGTALELPPSPEVAQRVPAFDLTVVEILEAAIQSEAETFRMFMNLSRKAGDAQASDILRELGEEEREHVEQLKRAREDAEKWGKYYRLPERLH